MRGLEYLIRQYITAQSVITNHRTIERLDIVLPWKTGTDQRDHVFSFNRVWTSKCDYYGLVVDGRCFVLTMQYTITVGIPTIVFDNTQIRSMCFNKELQLLMVVEGGPIVKIYQAGPHRIGEIEPAIAMKKHVIESKSRSMRLGQAAGKRGDDGVRTGAASAGGGGRGFEVGTANDSWHLWVIPVDLKSGIRSLRR